MARFTMMGEAAPVRTPNATVSYRRTPRSASQIPEGPPDLAVSGPQAPA